MLTVCALTQCGSGNLGTSQIHVHIMVCINWYQFSVLMLTFCLPVRVSYQHHWWQFEVLAHPVRPDCFYLFCIMLLNLDI